MDQYEIKFYKNDEEIGIEEMPDKYLNGIMQICKDEIVSRDRSDRVWSKMTEQINQKRNETIE